MGKLTGTEHGDAANDLVAFYQQESEKLEAAGSYFMAAIALGFLSDHPKPATEYHLKTGQRERRPGH
jgi:hypothetical protein